MLKKHMTCPKCGGHNIREEIVDDLFEPDHYCVDCEFEGDAIDFLQSQDQANNNPD